MISQRPEVTEKDIEESELDWWQQFAQIEYDFAWVQPSAVRRILRGRYVKEILNAAGKNAKILELGCGMGWLSIELAKHGATDVTGIDFSSAQINLANQSAKKFRVNDKVRFLVTDRTSDKLASESYDCVVVHAFLHHLNQSEIVEAVNSIKKLLKPNGILVIFEPILHVKCQSDNVSPLFDLQSNLAKLASRGKSWGLRKYSQDELKLRDLLAKRSWGKPPHGPSPKEMPFKKGELEQFLEPEFKIQSQKPYLIISHLVMQEWLLRKVSHPISTSAVISVIARLSCLIDFLLCKKQRLPNGQWVFQLLICEHNNP